MARPNKQGVDYFPLDVHLDDKFKFIEIKYKLEGFAVLVKLLQKVYSCGYWYKWTEDENFLFADEIRTDFDLVKNVVSECIKREVFDNNMYENYGILTSKGIQKRYKEIVRRRKDVEVIEEYLLIEGIFGVNDGINPEDGGHNDDKSTQSKQKVNKSKENKNKEVIDYSQQMQDLLLRYSDVEGFKDLIKTYWKVIEQTRKTGKIQPNVKCNTVKKWEEFNPIVVKYALTKHIENNYNDKEKDEKYTLGIMRRTTIEEAEDRLNSKVVSINRQSKQEPQGRSIPKDINLDLTAGEDW